MINDELNGTADVFGLSEAQEHMDPTGLLQTFLMSKNCPRWPMDDAETRDVDDVCDSSKLLRLKVYSLSTCCSVKLALDESPQGEKDSIQCVMFWMTSNTFFYYKENLESGSGREQFVT